MHYISTRNNSLKRNFKDILLEGLSQEGGLYLPNHWPKINIKKLDNLSYQQIAFIVSRPYLDSNITDKTLTDIIDKTYNNFTRKEIAPLIKIDKNKYILELFYGPTYAFKDYALQFLGNLFSNELSNSDRKVTIIVATSGDTGSAAINAFKGNKNINVFVLHPHKMISEVQRKQMTTIIDNNIHNIAIKGSFDDCQKLIKNLFLDHELRSKTT